MDKSREQFDQWLKQQGLKPVAWIKDEYWKVWKASRAAVEIELPNGVTAREALDAGYTCDYAAGMDDGIESCANACRAAGLKVKGE
ncbi:hypothetical protein R2301_003961 [Cronobacter dublinensis]|nr:hypothetical protein [Cronobacter dublinensis]